MPHLTQMNWDYKDQLLGATNGTFESYYVYDASGNRTRKVVEKGNVIEERFYVGNYEVYRKTTNGTLDLERETVHISDDQKRIAMIDNDGTTETIRYQYDNHLGSASLELDQNAATISYEEYHPFGTTSYRSGRTETEVSLKRYKYVGKERDEETGLYYYGARYYAAWIARFLSTDPMAGERSWVNPYNYVQNNPINRTDPTGALDDDPPNSNLEAIPINDVDWENFDTENQAILLDEITVSGGSENTNLVEPPQVLQDNLKDQQTPHVPELDAIWFRNKDNSYTLIDPKKNKQDQFSEYDPNFMMHIKNKLEDPSKSLSGKALKFGGRILYSTIDDVTVSLTNFALVQDIVGLEGAVNLDMTYTTPEESSTKGFSGLMTLGGFMTGLQKEAFKLPGNYSSYAKQANWTKKVNRQIKEFLRKQVYQNVLENKKVTKQASSISKWELFIEKSINDYNRNSK